MPMTRRRAPRNKTLPGGRILGGGPRSERAKCEFYPTAPQIIDALPSALAGIGITLSGRILEPGVGRGDIAKSLKKVPGVTEVIGIDIQDYGWPGTIIRDFIREPIGDLIDQFAAAVGNPPYDLDNEVYAASFIRQALLVAPIVIMLVNANWFFAAENKELIEGMKYAVGLAPRQSMYRGGEKTKNSGTINYVWTVFIRGHVGLGPVLIQLDCTPFKSRPGWCRGINLNKTKAMIAAKEARQRARMRAAAKVEKDKAKAEAKAARQAAKVEKEKAKAQQAATKATRGRSPK